MISGFKQIFDSAVSLNFFGFAVFDHWVASSLRATDLEANQRLSSGFRSTAGVPIAAKSAGNP